MKYSSGEEEMAKKKKMAKEVFYCEEEMSNGNVCILL